MLENINDYLSLFFILATIVAMAVVVFNALNLRKIEKNISKEIKYYKYEPENKNISKR